MINKTTLVRIVSNNILAMLNGRHGFDDWWYEVDDKIKDVIQNDIEEIIYKSYEDLEKEFKDE